MTRIVLTTRVRACEAGVALIDVVFTASLSVVLAVAAVPLFQATREYDAAAAAARFLANRLQYARFEAAKRNASVALRFDPRDVQRLALYVDGDGDGVLESDITAGIDWRLGSEHRLSDYIATAGLRIVRDVPEPEGSGTLAAGSDPVRIGRSNLLSFSPTGTSTGGTVFLAAESGPQIAIRILGATGRMRVLIFDRRTRQWRLL